MTVAIVGAGLSGLALAHHLDRVGEPFVLYEASAEPGGVVQSNTVDGRVLDIGPQRTRLTPAVTELVHAAGLEPRLRQAADRPLYVFHNGDLRRAPTDLRSAVTTDLLSIRGKLRVLGELFAAPPRADETVGTYLRRAFGTEVAERFIGPLYAGLYGSDLDEMYVRHSFGKAVERLDSPRSLLVAALRHRLGDRDLPPVVSFENGLQELALGLANTVADRLELATPVTEIERGSGAEDAFRIHTATEERTVDDVVFTTPAAVTATLLAGVAPDAAAALEGLTYNPLAVVHLVADGGLDAAGYQVALDEPLDTLGVTSNHGLFGRYGLHTCYLGGGQRPGLLEKSDTALGELAAREFVTTTGLDAESVNVDRLRPGMPAYDKSWTAMDDIELPAGLHLCANFSARAGIPGRARDARQLAESLTAQ
ncbi:protoporphyrinogen oxidase [halophilic archaeon DL31]|jgi:oxygen-dependent protoporphyrinogen oxidase|nr:protoporphyrinogen oxidase [halophilic archaeon DL31]